MLMSMSMLSRSSLAKGVCWFSHKLTRDVWAISKLGKSRGTIVAWGVDDKGKDYNDYIDGNDENDYDDDNGYNVDDYNKELITQFNNSCKQIPVHTPNKLWGNNDYNCHNYNKDNDQGLQRFVGHGVDSRTHYNPRDILRILSRKCLQSLQNSESFYNIRVCEQRANFGFFQESELCPWNFCALCTQFLYSYKHSFV